MQTPYIVIDEGKVRNNLSQMSKYANEKNIRIRPHCKTHKMPYFAKMQLGLGASGITVAKPSEAKIMAKEGITDIFIAYPIISPEKAELIKELNQSVEKLIVSIDSIQAASLLNGFFQGEKKKLKIRIEVNTGLNRTGATITDVNAIAEYVKTKAKQLELEGIYTFKGAVFEGKSSLELQKAGEEEGTIMLNIGSELRARGIHLETISVGSTPTAKTVVVDGMISEIRPGTYIFYDAMQLKLGVCSIEECAMTVVTTVVGKYDKHLVIDGGSKTFATDVQPSQLPLDLKGFGIIIDHPECQFVRMNEEHGVIEFNGSTNLELGDQVQIIPNHVCSTINLHNHVYLKRENDNYIKMPITARGQVY